MKKNAIIEKRIKVTDTIFSVAHFIIVYFARRPKINVY